MLLMPVNKAVGKPVAAAIGTAKASCTAPVPRHEAASSAIRRGRKREEVKADMVKLL